MLSRSKKLTSLGAPRMVIWILSLALLLVCMVILELTNVTHFFHKSPSHYVSTPTSGGASTNDQKGEPQANTHTPSSSGTQNGPNTSISSAQILIAPSGDFVSNHIPGQNGSPTAETSVCNTTSGATCQIVFTKDGVTKSLPTQLTDKGGSSYWNNWTPQQYGLTPGSWQVSAVAILNGQTKTTIDPTPLVVSI